MVIDYLSSLSIRTSLSTGETSLLSSLPPFYIYYSLLPLYSNLSVILRFNSDLSRSIMELAPPTSKRHNLTPLSGDPSPQLIGAYILPHIRTTSGIQPEPPSLSPNHPRQSPEAYCPKEDYPKSGGDRNFFLGSEFK